MFDLSKVKEFEWGKLYWIEYEVETSLTSLKESIDFHEKLIKNKTLKLKESIKNDKYLNSDDEDQFKAQYYGQFYEHEEIAINNLKFVLRNSTLLSTFTILEGKLKELCELIEMEIHSKLKYSDLKSRDGDIGQFKMYLTKVFEMNLKKSAKLLQLIGIHKIIRNKVTHSLGKIEKENLKRVNKLEGIKIVSSQDTHQIFISSPDYLIDLINLIKDFFNRLLEDIDERIVEIRKGNKK